MKISENNLYKLIYTLIFTPLAVRFFTDNFGMTYAIMPIFDIGAIILLIFAYCLTGKRESRVHILEIWLFIFVFAGVTSIIVNDGTSLSNLFYSGRPYFRMIAAMIITAIVFKLSEFEKLFKYMEGLLYINVIIMTFQFTIQGLRQDIIGGTFGNNQGVNAIQNILFVFVFCVTIEFYFKKLISRRKLIINTIAVLYVAVLAEINVVIFEVVIIAVLLVLLNDSSIRKVPIKALLFIPIGVIAILVALYLFMKFNPDRVFLLSFKNILEYLGFNSGSTGVYKISRVKVFSQLGNLFFKKDMIGWIFGYGLGNCSTHSAFYDLNQELQYTYFSSSNVFLETGCLGVFANLGVLITGLILSVKGKKRITDIRTKAWLNISYVMTFIMIMMFFYNTTLRDTYTAFFAGTILAIPYIISMKNKNSEN